MVGRRRAATTAFRPSAPVAAARKPSRGQTTAMLAGVLAVAVAIAVASFAVKPDKARSFDLFYGSVFVDDNNAPVAIDLSSGKATVQLNDASSAVSAKATQDLDMVPLDGGTLMLDPSTGEFNMLDSSGFVIKSTGGGVRLPQLKGSESSLTTAVPAGDSAYLVRPSTTGTAVYLVGQSTVASAVGVTGTGIKARASASLTRPTEQSPDVMTGANGSLWLMAGAADGERQVVQLSVPAGSNAGVPLTIHRYETFTGAAALTSATVAADGTGGDAVGAATAKNVRVFAPDGTTRDVAVTPPSDLKSIVPVRDGQGSLYFLYQGSSAWNLVRVPVAGGDAESHPVRGLSAQLDLVTPVVSNGSVYTILRETAGQLMQISGDGTMKPVPGLGSDGAYPIVSKERLNLVGAEITVRGSRVVFDARGNLKAVVRFTDGSDTTRVVDKHSAVSVDTNGSAAVNTDPEKQNDNTHKEGQKPKPTPHPETAVNNRINCKVASQTPHIPNLTSPQRASRSIQLAWTYPLLDPQDCDPSTYVVSLTATDPSDAPQPHPSQLTVQGQDGINITGLFPSTTYRMTVTAYINKLHTESRPIEVTTSPEGPAAPTNVRTSVDDKGNWTISWNSCGGIAQGCVPSSAWQIVPHLCDGVGLSSTPDTRRRVGDPTQHSFSYTYTGGSSLLGRGMSFDVEGVGQRGLVGDSAGDGACSYSWAHPITSDISVHASAPPMTSSGSATSSTNASVDFSGDQTTALGGVAGELTYRLLLDGTTVDSAGPTTKTSVQLAGIQAGRNYTVSVSVNPPRHPEAKASLAPIKVQAAVARWPTPAVSAKFTKTDNYTGTLSVTMSLPAGTNNHGETFDLTSGSSLRCGNAAVGLTRTNITSGQTMNFGGIDRTQYNGQCKVSLALQQNADTETTPPLYGDGTRSSYAATYLEVDVPSLAVGPDDFFANWNSSAPPGQPSVNIGYRGSDSKFLTYARNWVLRVSNDNGGTTCGRSETPLDYGNAVETVGVSKDCIRNGGNFIGIVSFSFYGQGHTYQIQVSGSAPQPVDETKMKFSAEWHNPLIGQDYLTFSLDSPYSQDELGSLNWTYRVTSSTTPNVNCIGESFGNPTPNGGDTSVPINFQRCPAVDRSSGSPVDSDYTLIISFTDPNYGVDGSQIPPIDVGTAP